VDRRRLRPADHIKGDGLMHIAAEAAKLKIAVAAVEASPIVGDG
jgi:hypothetical protein